MTEDLSPKMLLILGREAYQNQEFDTAESYLRQFTLRQLIEEKHAFADIHYMLGMIYYERSEYNNSKKEFEAALTINPSYTEAALHLAIILSDTGKYEEASVFYEQVQSLHKNSTKSLDTFLQRKIANLHKEIGNLYSKAFHHEDAVKEYHRALELQPNFPDIRLKLANSYRELGSFELAQKEYNLLFEQFPNYYPATLQYGMLEFMQGNKEKAKLLWSKVLEKDPSNQKALLYIRSLEQKSKSRLLPPNEKDDSLELSAIEILKSDNDAN